MKEKMKDNERDMILKLTQATNHINKHHLLPRCEHNNALQDHVKDFLFPSCGCVHKNFN